MTLGEGIEQFYVFVVFVFVGTTLGALYLFFNGFFQKRFGSVLFDVAFGCLGACYVWHVNFRVNDGVLREYVVLGIIVGIALVNISLKSMLDKARTALYNLFILDIRDERNELLSRQKNVDTCCGVGADCGVASLGASHKSCANGNDESKG